MDYEAMWNKLKEFINDKYENEYDDIPQYIYQGVLDTIDEIESEYTNSIEHGDYVCIKDYSSVFTEGVKCFIITEGEDYYVIEDINDGYAIDINKSVFDDYFQLIGN